LRQQRLGGGVQVVAEAADIQEQVVQLYLIQAAFINPGTSCSAMYFLGRRLGPS
jgi:hypothetical protein